MSNTFKIEIELPKSNGFSTRTDRHLADIVQRRVQAFLQEPSGMDGCRVTVVSSGD